jgi:hypothetical protein
MVLIMSNIETKYLSFGDNVESVDKFSLKNMPKTFNSRFGDTRVIFRDEKGNIILEKENLIVLRGRTFALEKLFNDVITVGSGYDQDLNRQIVLFKIGSGGADVTNDPFNPYTPNFADEDLASEIPFIIVDPDKMADPAKAANPSIFVTLPSGYENIYYDKRTVGTVDSYYAKKFETAPEWYFNKLTNEVYKKVTLAIAVQDARDEYINELSLLLANYDNVGNAYNNIELFSRICFDTESLVNHTKQIIIEYYIYA